MKDNADAVDRVVVAGICGLNSLHNARVAPPGRQVARFAYLHSSQEAREFMRAWEGAPENPGAK